MQVLVSLPGDEERSLSGGLEQSLFRKVCGIPLLVRVIATAGRAGARKVLLLHPESLPKDKLKARLDSRALGSLEVEMLALDHAFSPDSPEDWRAVEGRLEEKFLWLPWNYAADKKALSRLIEAARGTTEGVRFDASAESEGIGAAAGTLELPVVIERDKLMRFVEGSTAESKLGGGPVEQYLSDRPLLVVSVSRPPGIPVLPGQSVREVERELVRRSGKETDGFYSTFNRRLCRPAVRWLTKTPITPNMVSFAGMGVTVISGYWFAQGYWDAYVIGALLYFISVLVDEMDGMLARLKFRESAFGCWLETFIDYTSYIFIFVGMSIGLYRESGEFWLWAGGLLLFGTVVSFFVVSRQRKLATDPDRPNEYLSRIHRRLEADSGNILSRFGRYTEFLIRRCALGHYVLLFSLLDELEALFLISAFGSNLVWTLALSYNRLFRQQDSRG